ncbi:MAG: iron-sulfur cluster assembly protein [bacterium]
MAAIVTEERVLDALQEVIDPELNISIVDLGLVYSTTINDDNEVHVLMTLTTMGCPMGESIAKDSEQAVMAIEGVKDVLIEITFEPPWDINMMSDFAKDRLGLG